MTETPIRTAPLTEALALIDRGLTQMQSRELVSASEVGDLLLDVRLLLTAVEPDLVGAAS